MADRSRAHALFAKIDAHASYEIVAATQQVMRAGLGLHRQAYDKDWSLTDCISFIVMRERGLQRALAHDHHFEQAGFEALLRREPP